MPAPDPERLAFFLSKGMAKAIYDYQMIAPGDRMAVGTSGGKDSLALLALLARWRRYSPEPFTLGALYFPVQAAGPVPVPEGLEAWVSSLGLTLTVLPVPPASWPLTCQRCAALRRRALLEGAAAGGYGQRALGHHAVDLAATVLINLVKHGRLDTMAPLRAYRGVTLIRPLVYLPERELARYARAAGFPVQPSSCPLAPHTDRARATELLRLALRLSRQARINLGRAALAATCPPLRQR